MSERQSTPVATTRKGALAARSTSILKGCCSLAFLLVFLLAAASTASATVTTTTLNIGLASSPGISIAGGNEPFGTSVTLTAIVTSGATGTVTFTDGISSPTTLCSAVTVNFGQATCTTSALLLGSNSLNAAFTGSGSYGSSATITPTTLTMQQYTTTTTLAALAGVSTTTAPYGASVTLTATVGGTALAASSPGTVSFTYGTSPIIPIAACSGANAQPVNAGVATCTTTALPVASDDYLNAVFTSNTAAFTSSATTSSLDFAVTQITTTTSLLVGLQSAPLVSVSAEPYGTNVTLTATVTGAEAAGTVSFLNGTTPIAGCSGATAVSVVAGSAACTTATLPKGTLTLNADFTPTVSADFTATSGSAPYTVGPNTPVIVLTPSTGSTTYGSLVTLNVTGIPAGAGAGDTVTFFYGSNSTATSDTTAVTCVNTVTIASGAASCLTVMLPVAATPGNYLKAVFTPATASNYSASSFSSALANVIVAKATPIVVLTTSPSGTAPKNASVTLTATLPSAMDTGTVAFTWGPTSTPATAIVCGAGSGTVSSTTALGVSTTTVTCITSALTAATIGSPGNYLKAVYTPTTATNFGTILPATGNLIVVGAVATTLAVTASSPSYYGSTMLTATVACSGTCTSATGSVAFFNNGSPNPLAGTVLNPSGGVYTLIPTVPLPIGANIVTAAFTTSGVGGYNSVPAASSTPATVTVVATPTTSVAYAFTGAITAPTGTGGTPYVPTGTAVTATSASTSSANNSFTLYATVVPSAGTTVINGGHVSFYDVSTAGSTLLGTAAVAAVNNVGVAQFSINCASAIATCSGPLSNGKHYFSANYGGVFGGTGAAQISGSMSATVPVTISGTPVLTITAASPSVVYGSAVPAISPAPYTISGAAPISTDLSSCTTSSKDGNGISIYSCATLPSLLPGNGGKVPVCTTAYTTSSAVGSSPATTCAGAKDANYTIAAYVPGTVTVTGAAPTITFTSAPEVTYGTALTLAATTNSGGAAPTFVVTTTPNCVSSCATKSATTIPATTVPGSYTVTATSAANGNYAQGTQTQTIVVNQAKPSVNWPEPKAIVYGNTLSTSTLGACNASYGSANVSGSCAWASIDSASTTYPSVGSTHYATFTPNPSLYGTGSTAGYATVTEEIPANVTPATPIIFAPPSATSISDGTLVNVSKLSSGTVHGVNTGSGVPTLSGGTWSWTCTATSTCAAVSTGNNYTNVTYTPSAANAANYSTVTSSNEATQANVTGISVSPTFVATWPTASAITYGQPLSSSVLGTAYACEASGSCDATHGTLVAGTFSWTSPTLGAVTTAANTYPAVGSDPECVTFTPSSPNYATIYSNGAAACSSSGSNVNVTVSQAPPTVNWSAVPAKWIPSGSLLSAATLPGPTSAYAKGHAGVAVSGTFTWDASAADGTTIPPIGTSTYLADFTPTDGADYLSSETGMVAVSVNACGLQDSVNNINAAANFVNTDHGVGAAQITSGAGDMTIDLEGVTDESVLCAFNNSTSDTTVTTTVKEPALTLGSTNSNATDAISYGTNAAVLAYGTSAIAGFGTGATVTVTDSTGDGTGTAGSITTNNDYSGGVFASMGGTVNITNTNLATNGNHSRALSATYEGTLGITNVTAATTGTDSAVIVTGTGSGQVTVAGGSYTSTGTSSTATIQAAGTCPTATTCSASTLSTRSTPWSTVSVGDGSAGTTITANNGPAVVVEGGNAVTIDSTGNLTSLSATLGNNYGVLLYQSGTLTDATAATALNPATFSMTGGSLSYVCDVASVPSCSTGTPASDQNTDATLFSVTNTIATINLTDVAVTNTTNSGGDGILLTAAQLSTGPATATLNLTGENITGDVIVDKNSTVNLSLAHDSSNPTTWTGTIANGIYYDSGSTGPQTQGTVNLTIDTASTWIVTGSNVTVNTLTDTDTDPTYGFLNIVCAVANPGCTVNIASPTVGQPSSFNPN